MLNIHFLKHQSGIYVVLADIYRLSDADHAHMKGDYTASVFLSVVGEMQTTPL